MAGIRHRDFHVAALLRAWIERCGIGAEDHVLRAQGQRSPARHRVPGVHAKIHQHLVHLGGIGLHRPEIERRSVDDLDVAREGFPDDLGHLSQQRKGICPGSWPFGATAEEQQLPNDGSAAPGAAFDHPDILHVLGRLEPLAKELGGQQDRQEDVVEVMCDATRQGPDHFHPLSAQILLLHLFALGDVEFDSLGTNDLAGRVIDRHPDDVHAAGSALAVGILLLLLHHLSCSHDEVVDGFALLGVLDERLVLAARFLLAPHHLERGPPHQLVGAQVLATTQLGIDHDVAPLAIHPEDPVRQLLDEGMVKRLGGTQGLLRPLAFREVADQPEKSAHLTLFVAERGHGDQDRDAGSVLANEGPFILVPQLAAGQHGEDAEIAGHRLAELSG